MRVRHRRLRNHLLAAAAVAVAAPLIVVALPSGSASAHGTMSNPPSRSYTCRNGGTGESPDSAACRAAVAAGGTQAFYDWNEVSLLDCGRAAPARSSPTASSAARAGTSTAVSTSSAHRLARHRASRPATSPSPTTPPHPTRTATSSSTSPGRAGIRRSRCAGPTWSTSERSTTRTRPRSPTGRSPIPQRTGRHILYSIWQRVVGSEEAFYTCSDVDFGGGTNPPPPPPPTTNPPPTPAAHHDAPPPPPGGTWAARRHATRSAPGSPTAA